MTTFKIKSIQGQQASCEDGLYVSFNAEIEPVIEVRCDEHRNLFRTLKLIVYPERSHDPEHAFRKVIQNLLDHNYHVEVDFHLTRCDCCPEYGRMQYDFNDLHPVEWRELFESLFTDANWKVQHELAG